MTDFPRVRLELAADAEVRDRFKLSLKVRDLTLDEKGCIHVFVDSGDLSNLSHDITVARLEDDDRSGKLELAQTL